MRRLAHAPNLAIATLWADMLNQAGFGVSVQRQFASGIAGDIPPDQSRPELWLMDDSRLDAAKLHLEQLRHLPHRHWACRTCHEVIDGPFEQCWNCGADMPHHPNDPG